MSLEQQFEIATPEDPTMLDGAYAVHLVADLLPKPVRFLGHTKVFRRGPRGIVGCNEFLGGRVKAGHFRVERGVSRDGAEVTKIVYDDPRNPFFMRPLTDEVRAEAPDRWLGRGMFTLGKWARQAFWFTVTRESPRRA